MSNRTRFILTILALLVLIGATIFGIYRYRIGADTIVSVPANMTPETAKIIYDKQSAEYDRINKEIMDITMSTPNREKKLEFLRNQREMIVDGMMANLNYLNQFPAYSVLKKNHADLTPEASTPSKVVTKSAKEQAAKERSDYSISVGINYCHPLSPGQVQDKRIEELRNVFAQNWDQAKAIYDTFEENPTNPARINAPLKLFKDKMAPYLAAGVLPTEVLQNLQANFLADDGKNMETTFLVSKESAQGYFESIIGLQTGTFDREKFDYELKNTVVNSKNDTYADPKFTAEQIDLMLQAMFPSYATAVSMYQEQMKIYAGFSDEIKIAGLANFMSHGDADRYEIIYNYLVEHKDAKMMDFLNANISVEMKMGYISNYLKTNDIFKKAYGSSISINSNTGHVEYTSVLRQKIGDNNYRTLGYISFDPTSNSFDAMLPIEFGSKNITLFSEPRTGDVWVELGNADSSPLLGQGKYGLMSVTVSKDGKIGGQFRMFNRLFAYNANTQAFEMPVKISNSAQFTIDTKGNVRGDVGIFGDTASKSQGSLFFDRNGNMGVTLDVRTASSEYGRVSTASIMYSKDGGLAGTVDMGKILGGNNASSFFLSFDKSGVTGVNVPFGSWAGKPFGLGIGADGSLSIGGFVPIAGLPVPVGLGQDSKGGVRLTWPGGSLSIIGGDDRPQNPPALKTDTKTNFYDASTIYFRHSFKKGFKAIRVYQVPPETIDRDEQIARGDMIIKVYAELLGRNPSIGEFLNWYFYSGHELYKFPDHKQKEYRMTATEAALRKVIKKGPYANMSAQFKFPNKEEYEWIKAGKDPLQYPKRPKETLTKNPFSDGSLVINGQKVSYTTMNDLVKSIVDSSKDDDGKILDQTSVINDVADETTVVDDTATSEDASGNTTESSNSTTTVTERPSNMPASSDLPLDSKLNDPANKTSKVAITNDESKKRADTVDNAITQLDKIALSMEEKQLAEKMIEIAKEQVEAEKQIIQLLNRLEAQSKISSFLIGPDNDVIDQINKAQIDNNVRNKALSQISAKVTDKETAENIYTQNRAMELANQEMQKAVDEKQEQFSLFGWIVKLFNNIVN